VQSRPGDRHPLWSQDARLGRNVSPLRGVAPDPRAPHPKEDQMIDVVYVLATLAFFAVAWAYARACDRI
jgi:hypothetical protein